MISKSNLIQMQMYLQIIWTIAINLFFSQYSTYFQSIKDHLLHSYIHVLYLLSRVKFNFTINSNYFQDAQVLTNHSYFNKTKTDFCSPA